MPGLPGDDRIEGPAGGVPGFERRYLNVESALSGERGHPRVDETLAAFEALAGAALARQGGQAVAVGVPAVVAEE